MSEDAYYSAIAADRNAERPIRGRGRPQKGAIATPAAAKQYAPKRLFRRPLVAQEAMIPRLAKALVSGLATHRNIHNSLTGERTWLLRDQAATGDWWMIDPHVDSAARKLIELAMDELQGRAELTAENIVQTIQQWEINDMWTVLLRRDPASRLADGATPKQIAKSEAYARRHLP